MDRPRHGGRYGEQVETFGRVVFTIEFAAPSDGRYGAFDSGRRNVVACDAREFAGRTHDVAVLERWKPSCGTESRSASGSHLPEAPGCL